MGADEAGGMSVVDFVVALEYNHELLVFLFVEDKFLYEVIDYLSRALGREEIFLPQTIDIVDVVS